MKKYFHLVFLISFMCYAFSFTSCSEAENVGPKDEPGIEHPESKEDTISIHPNDSIGLLIDTRPIFKKGYKPTLANLNFSGGFSTFSKELPVDELTNLAILRISRDELKEDEIEQLSNGVPLVIQIVDDQGALLAEVKQEKVAISNTSLTITTDLPKIYAPLKLDQNTPYFVQLSNLDEVGYEPEDVVVWQAFSNPNAIELVPATSFDMNIHQSFYFEQAAPENDSVFYIKRRSNAGSIFYLSYGEVCNIPLLTFTNDFSPAARFVLKQSEDGITIQPLDGNPLRKFDSEICDHFNGTHLSEGETGPIAKFRIVTTEIEWTVEDLGSKFNAPLLPPAKTEFAYKTFLSNCSEEMVTESIGKEDVRISSFTLNSEETFQLVSDHTVSSDDPDYFAHLDVSVGPYQLPANYSYRTSLASSPTKGIAGAGQQEVRISEVRTIDIPPYSGMQIYDAAITYDKVSLPFVQKIRITGQYNNTRVPAEQILSQLLTKPFNGVIIETGRFHVTFTLKGNVSIDQVVEVINEVSEVKDYCVEE